MIPLYHDDLRVALSACADYELLAVEEILRGQLTAIIGDLSFFEGKRVVVKPNLITKIAPEGAATTHPSLVEAVCRIIKSQGGTAIIAESSGGPYTESSMRSHYKGTGIALAAEKSGATLNYDPSWENVSAPNGVKSRNFNVIKPILDADIVINLCKLKAHGFTQLSCATKNLFGVVPGTQKFEMHARFNNIDGFSGMIVDLCDLVHTLKTTVDICDAVIAMEGNGPTAGNPRRVGALLTSRNPYALDTVAAELIGFSGRVEMLKAAALRGFIPSEFDKIEIIGADINSLRVEDFVRPDTQARGLLRFALTAAGGRFAKYIEPRPKINDRLCRGCGECVRSCPVRTIEMKSGKKTAKIRREKCIKCYCCQELCPFKAVKIKKNFVLKLVDNMK